MSLLTPFLKLFKWNTEDTEDLEQPFDIKKAMNENWDKLDTKAQEQENKISDIETNIEDIETKNTEQDKLIQKLQNALINETSQQDTSLHIEDASDVPAVLSIEGNHYQETREGYNQLKSTLEDVELNGISVKYHNDGSVTLNGTTTAATAIQVSNNSVELENTDYTYCLEGKTQDFNFYVKQSTDTNHTVLESSSLLERIVKNLGAITIIGAYLYIQKDTVLNSVTVYPMIYKGTEEKEYEQYGAMPSVEYPSPIRTVGDNINILPNNFTSKTENGLDCTVNSNKSIHVVGTATATTHLILVGSVGTGTAEEVLKFKANKQYKNISNVDVLYQKTDNSYGRLLKDTKFSFETDASIRGLYLQINNGETVDETYYPKLVEYYEGMDESYSQYNQGSVEVKKINKNFYKLDIEGVSRNGVDYTVENGIVTAKRTATAESGSYLNTNRTKLPAGTYVISGVDDTFVYANARIEVYTSDTIDGNATQITTLMNTRLSYKYTSDKTFYLSFSVVITGATAVNDTFIFKPQAEKNDNDTASTFVEHQEQSYVLPIQQEMLDGDYFDLERGKEVHHFHKYVSTSADNWVLTPDSPNRFRFDTNITTKNNALNNTNQYCSHSSICSAWASPDKSFQVRRGSIYFKTTDFSTAEEFNQFVAEQEEAGTPLTFWYECEEYELDLTEEQKEVLQQLNNLDLFKGTNIIYTEQGLALLQLDYTVDTKMYIDNKIASNNAVGGN